MEELIDFEGSDRFELRDQLGSGGVGTVYRAWDKERGQEVALKILRARAADALYAFKREFRTLADVAHPNLVALYELFAETDECYFTMEVVDGVSFLDYVRPGPDGGVLNVERLRDAMRQLAEGVAALHDAGKLHRDLKPSNVMVNPDGQVIILDFGVATDLRPEDQSDEGMIIGTIAYMAPEQAAGTTTSAVTDWYAFGVILFQALTGELPFQGGVYQVIVAKQTEQPPSPATLADDLPEDLVDLCCRLMAKDPTARPSGAEVLQALGAELDDFPSTSERQLLIGRDAEMAELVDAFNNSRRGQAVAVYIYGQSGMGKTTLVQSFLNTYGSKGVVLRGRCYQREMVPFKALDGVVDSLSRYLAGRDSDELVEILPPNVRSLVRIFPVLDRVEMPESRFDPPPLAADLVALRRQAFTALRELLTRLAWKRPLVLYIDDLQWADADSIVLIDELLRPPNAPPLVLIASFRSEEISRHLFLQELLQQPLSDVRRHLEVAPLNDARSAELARTLVGNDAAAGPLIQTIVQEGKGSPFLVEQLSRFVQAQAERISTGMTLSELLGARIRQLPEGCRPLLLTLTVANRPLNPQVARKAAGIDGDVERLVAALRAAHLVRWSGAETRLELYHDRIRETLSTFIDQLEQRQIHGHLASALVALGYNDPEALFAHYLAAGNRSEAAHQAVLAARKSFEALAFEPAANFYSQALDLGAAKNDEELNELRRGLAESYTNAGRTGEAAAAYLDLAAGATALDALQARCLAVEQFLIGGDVEDGLRAARHTLGQVGLGMPRGSRQALLRLIFNRLRIRLRGVGFEQQDEASIPREELVKIDTSWAMAKGLSMVNTIQGADFQTRHLLLSLRVGEPYRVACALAMEAGFIASSGDGERSEELLNEAMTLARRVGHPHAIGVALLQKGVLEYFTGRSWPAAVAAFDEAEKVLSAGCRNIVWELNFCRRFGLAAMRNLGEIGELKTRVPLCLAEARDRGNRTLARTVCSRLGIIWLADDDPEMARSQIAESQRASSNRRGYTVDLYNVLRAELEADLYVGDGRSARERIEGAFKPLSKSMVFRVQMPRIEAQEMRGRAALAYAAAPQGFPESKELLLKTAADAAEKILDEKKLWAKPLAQSLQAGVASLEGNDERARLLLESAADGFEATHSHLYAAVARRRLGALIGGDSGEDLLNRAELWLRRQQIKNTDAMTAMMIPGFKD